jgi:hypothetical protein
MDPNLETVQALFAKMNADGLDTSKPLKWGFFFMDKTKDNLLEVVHELSGYNYMVDSLHRSDDGTWVLLVNKVEVLTPENLHKRNIAFNELAEHCGVELYDGWDVGNSEG